MITVPKISIWVAQNYGAGNGKNGAETDNNFSCSRKCGLHGVPKMTKSKCRKKVPKLVATFLTSDPRLK
jgi:hypothetical protein